MKSVPITISEHFAEMDSSSGVNGRKRSCESNEEPEAITTSSAVISSASSPFLLPDDINHVNQATNFLSQGIYTTDMQLLCQYLEKFRLYLEELEVKDELSEPIMKKLNESGAYPVVMSIVKIRFEYEKIQEEGICVLLSLTPWAFTGFNLDASRSVIHSTKLYPQNARIQYASFSFLGSLMSQNHRQRFEEARKFMLFGGVQCLLSSMRTHLHDITSKVAGVF